MRIFCTSVEESIHKDEIYNKAKKVFKKYHVVVIPNKYATEKGREEVLAYSRKYHEENREWERFKNNKRRHLNRIEKSKKEGLIEDGKSFNKLIIDLSNNVSEYYENLKNDEAGIFDETINSRVNDITISNMSESISCYTNDNAINKKIVDNMWKHIENSRFPSLSKDDILRETAKVVIKSLKQIRKEQDKLKEENTYGK